MAELSNKIINRLTLYHCLLKYSVREKNYISSTEIAEWLNLDDSLVRKDIALCGVLGHQKQGYACTELKQSIEQRLGFSTHKEVIIIGAGHLGTALAKYADFKDYGIEISALFDNDTTKVGQQINGKKIYPLSELKKHSTTLNVKNVILSVPPHQAQSVADEVIRCGARFIWNFTPTILHTPKSITVYYENIISSFLQMQNNQTAL